MDYRVMAVLMSIPEILLRWISGIGGAKNNATTDRSAKSEEKEKSCLPGNA
jgi:hypothetical protein